MVNAAPYKIMTLWGRFMRFLAALLFVSCISAFYSYYYTVTLDNAKHNKQFEVRSIPYGQRGVYSHAKGRSKASHLEEISHRRREQGSIDDIKRSVGLHQRDGRDKNNVAQRRAHIVKPILEAPSFHRNDILRNGPKLNLNKTLNHDKWIVVTSVSPPTPDVMFLANITGWKVVVVGDVKSPKDWSYPNCVFLDIRQQEALGLRITARLPYRSYARKNVGYLFAIAHGAKVIYETDDDNRPLDKLISFKLDEDTPGLLFSGADLFNPYRHFGQPTLWPRGYPLREIGTVSNMTYRSRLPTMKINNNWSTPIIQQGVVNGDPDMDAIFRLTRKRTFSKLNVLFDPAAPPVILPESVFSPFNSQNTLFLQQAMWAMLLPTTTTFRICDIWRGYWAQRLMWEIGGRLGFLPPNAYQQRNAHSYMEDARDEEEMYFDTDRLLSFLTQWTCPNDFSFFQCVFNLSEAMASDGFWGKEDVAVTRLWLEDLVRVGYVEPSRIHVKEEIFRTVKKVVSSHRNKEDFFIEAKEDAGEIENAFTELDMKWALTVRQGTLARFEPAEQVPPAISPDPARQVSDISRHLDQVATLCPGLPLVSSDPRLIKKGGVSPFHDILLVVVFNWPHYANIVYLEAMYRVLFPNIAYCGHNSTYFYESTRKAKLERDFTFVEAPVIGGMMGYQCAIKVMQMEYNVRGYFIVGDDVILNVWNFATFPKDKVWMDDMVYVFNMTQGTEWMWWDKEVGRKAYTGAFSTLKDIKTRFPRNVTPLKQFLSMLANNTGGVNNSVHAISDTYYIPSRLRRNAVFYLSHFIQRFVMVELAVPTINWALEEKDEVIYFTGTNLWMQDRVNPWSKFNPGNHYLHPVKFSDNSNIHFLCTLYLPNLLIRGHANKVDARL